MLSGVLTEMELNFILNVKSAVSDLIVHFADNRTMQNHMYNSALLIFA